MSTNEQDVTDQTVDSVGSEAEHAASAGAVTLELPLHHRHASTVRVVAASLAADIGFSVDEIDDLRLGVDEAVSIVADIDATDAARLLLHFEPAVDSITVRVSRVGAVPPVGRDQVDELASRILAAVVDHFEVDDSGTFVVVKRVAPHGG